MSADLTESELHLVEQECNVTGQIFVRLSPVVALKLVAEIRRLRSRIAELEQEIANHGLDLGGTIFSPD